MKSVMVFLLHEPFSLRRWFPQHTLAGCGFALLALTLAGFFWVWCDRRKVGGEAVAFKPIRFALSIGVYMLTASATFNYVRPERQSALLPMAAVWMMVIGSAVELACIVLQAARARRSHFNTSTRIDAAIFAAMGVFAVLFVGALLPLAWEIARRPHEHANPTMVMAIVAGLLATFILGGGTGALMSSRGAHAVGKDKGRLPLFGWNMAGGDLRAPHFFGIHAMQALPIIAVVANAISSRQATAIFLAGALAYGLLTTGLLYQALHGKAATSLQIT